MSDTKRRSDEGAQKGPRGWLAGKQRLPLLCQLACELWVRKPPPGPPQPSLPLPCPLLPVVSLCLLTTTTSVGCTCWTSALTFVPTPLLSSSCSGSEQPREQ